MLRLRRLVTDFSATLPGFNSRLAHVGFVVDIVALGQLFLQVLHCSSVSITSPRPHTHLFITNTILSEPFTALFSNALKKIH
jgi:hypothetical protein